ncbi:hypothetical protein [Nocardioides sp.]|uniref:hypothetical protein n=1 Tax=Nocardioides sp. TaxID=35761 RepID=UPI003784F826
MSDPDVVAKVSRGLGEAMVGINVEDAAPPGRARLVGMDEWILLGDVFDAAMERRGWDARALAASLGLALPTVEVLRDLRVSRSAARELCAALGIDVAEVARRNE